MTGVTNRGKFNLLDQRYRGTAQPTNFFIALLTNTNPPTADTNLFSQVTEIAAGNGYVAGGQQLTPGAVDFDVITQDDVNDRALVQLRDISWTAASGNIPASGDGASWACITDDNATEANRNVEDYFSLGAPRTVSDTQTLTLQDCEIRLNET